MEIDFYRGIEELSKITKKRDFLKKAEELKAFVYSKKNPYYAYRLGLELDGKQLPVQDLEDFIFSCMRSYWSPHWLLAWARNVSSANILRCQEVIVASQAARYIAEFACFVPEADFDYLQQIILEIGKPAGADVLIRYRPKQTNIQQFIPLLLKSKKPKYLTLLAEHTTDPALIKKIWDLMLKTKSLHLIRQFWVNHQQHLSLPELEEKVLATRNIAEIKKTFDITKSKKLARYVLMM